MKKLIFILSIYITATAKTPIEDLSSRVILASNVQIGLFLVSGFAAFVGYDQIDGSQGGKYWFYSAGGAGFAGLVLPPLIIKNAVIKFRKSQLKIEVKF